LNRRVNVLDVQRIIKVLHPPPLPKEARRPGDAISTIDSGAICAGEWKALEFQFDAVYRAVGRRLAVSSCGRLARVFQ
jgi:hypothetical protein